MITVGEGLKATSCLRENQKNIKKLFSWNWPRLKGATLFDYKQVCPKTIPLSHLNQSWVHQITDLKILSSQFPPPHFCLTKLGHNLPPKITLILFWYTKVSDHEHSKVQLLTNKLKINFWIHISHTLVYTILACTKNMTLLLLCLPL